MNLCLEKVSEEKGDELPFFCGCLKYNKIIYRQYVHSTLSLLQKFSLALDPAVHFGKVI